MAFKHFSTYLVDNFCIPNGTYMISPKHSLNILNVFRILLGPDAKFSPWTWSTISVDKDDGSPDCSYLGLEKPPNGNWYNFLTVQWNMNLSNFSIIQELHDGPEINACNQQSSVNDQKTIFFKIHWKKHVNCNFTI